MTFRGQKRPFKKQEKSEKLEPPLAIIEFSERLELKQKAIRKDGSPKFSERWEPRIRRD